MGDGGSHSQMFARSTHVMLPAPRPKKKNFRPPAAASQGSCLQRNMLRVLSFRLFFLLSERAILRTEMKCACALAVCRHACNGDVRKVFYILVVGTWPACPKRPATYWNPGSIHVGCRQLVRAPKQPTTPVHRDQHQPRTPAPFAFTTALQVLCHERAMLPATVCALWLWHRRLTRSLYTVFPGVARRAFKSAKSEATNCFRNHAQNFSTGFRSGERAGICSNEIACALYTSLAALARKKPSPSHSTVQGPRRR